MADILSGLATGIAVTFTPFNMMIGFLGVVLGMLFGILPGLGPLNGVAILLPVTFVLPPESSMIFIAAIYYAGTAGGAITSISLNIPGTPMAAATCLDGHPMAKKGEGALAIFTAATASLIGGLLACVGFVFLAPPLARYALFLRSAGVLFPDDRRLCLLRGTQRKIGGQDRHHDRLRPDFKLRGNGLHDGECPINLRLHGILQFHHVSHGCRGNVRNRRGSNHRGKRNKRTGNPSECNVEGLHPVLEIDLEA